MSPASLLFAYGSNLSSRRLRARAPSAVFIGPARLDGYVLRFHKRSRDGSSKANAFHTGRKEDALWGAVFDCLDADKVVLDHIEELGHGYDEEVVTVRMEGGEAVQARMYVAAPHTIDDTLRPYTWYLDYVLAGAVEQGLPAGHVEVIRRHGAIRDLDRERELRNTVLLQAS